MLNKEHIFLCSNLICQHLSFNWWVWNIWSWFSCKFFSNTFTCIVVCLILSMFLCFNLPCGEVEDKGDGFSFRPGSRLPIQQPSSSFLVNRTQVCVGHLTGYVSENDSFPQGHKCLFILQYTSSKAILLILIIFASDQSKTGIWLSSGQLKLWESLWGGLWERFPCLEWVEGERKRVGKRETDSRGKPCPSLLGWDVAF